MDQASCGGKKIEGALALGVELRRSAAFVRRELFLAGELGDAFEPAGSVEIAQAAGRILKIGLEMENGLAIFRVALTGELGEILAEGSAIAGDDTGKHVIAELEEKRFITGKIPAIEKRNIELRILALKFCTFGKRASGRANPHAHIPERLAEFP